MSAAARILLIALLGGCGHAALAQSPHAEALGQQWAKCEPGSPRWYAVGFEVVEAWFDVDVRRAREFAQQLEQSAARSAGPSDRALRATCTAYAALCTARTEGLPAVAAWTEQLRGGMPTDAAAELRARFHFAVMRLHAIEPRDAAILQAAVAAREAALQSGDPLLRARMALVVHALGNPGERHTDAALASARAALAEPTVAHMSPWVHYQNHAAQEQLGNADEGKRAGELAEQESQRLGNRRVAILMARSRATDAGRANDLEQARRHAVRALAISRELGECDGIARALEFLADIDVLRGDLPGARALVDEALALIDGRGLHDCELGLLRTGRTVALRLEDGARATAIEKRIETLSSDEQAQRPWAEMAELRGLLLRTEAASLDAADRLAAEQRQADERRRNALGLIAAATVLLLGIFTGLSLRSRRRLLVANARLREEMQRNREAQEAQSRLEERIRHLERMESLDMMARGIAHDLNNLMVGVLGNAEILEGLVADEDQRGRVEAITASGQRAARMCRQLQAYAGNTPLDLRPIDVNRVVNGMLPVLRAATGEQVQIVHANGRRGLAVQGDQSQLEQVLLNLVQNARDAGARHVTIEARSVELGASDLAARNLRGDPRPGAHVEITVGDDGSGMPADVASRVFDPFFTTRFPGRGLGLAVVLGIVRRHGGGIELESTVGTGSRFKIVLPATAPAPDTDSTILDVGPQCDGRGQSILIVDDEATVRDYVSTALNRRGFRTSQAEDGVQALSLLADAPSPPVVLLDVTMPELDGIEVLRRIRSQFPATKVVLMSGHGETYLNDATAEVRPDATLPKPFTAGALLAALAACQSAESVSR